MLKKHLIIVLLTIILFIPFLFLKHFMRSITDVITKGMSSLERGRVENFVVCIPIIAGCFLIDFIKKYWDKK